MKKINIVLILIITLTSCCSWKAWIGYEKPNNSDFVAIMNSNIKVGTQNLNDAQKSAIMEASADVFEIFNSHEFQIQVESQNWLASCKINESDNKDMLEGKEVYKELMNNFIDFSVNPKNPCAAIAQSQKHSTKNYKNRIAIRPDRIQKWYSSDKKEKSKLINTIAHEITHVTSYKFIDKGHGTNACPDKDLVSYGIGDLVETLWINN